jgi:hypothetical protein
MGYEKPGITQVNYELLKKQERNRKEIYSSHSQAHIHIYKATRHFRHISYICTKTRKTKKDSNTTQRDRERCQERQRERERK